MQSDLTFKDVCDFLKKDDHELIEAVGNLYGLIIVLSPIVLGPQALPALGLLRAKDQVTSLAKQFLEKITNKKESDYLARVQRMKMAHTLICFTAFFEALDEVLPDDLRQGIELLPNEKKAIAEEAVTDATCETRDGINPSDTQKASLFDSPVPLPHPAISFEDHKTLLINLYEQMAKRFADFVQKLEVWDAQDKKSRAAFEKLIKELPKVALNHFEGQYFELARKFHDFFIWSRLHQATSRRSPHETYDRYLEHYRSLLADGTERIDVGFNHLQNTVLSMPNHFRAVEARNIVDALKRHYEARIDEPIIEDRYEPVEGQPALVFPKVSEAFIPQSYRVLRYTTKERRLEKEDTWNSLETRHDLGAFLTSYLSSPYSTETPLLILGHPGSGKSLLTKVLCAKLMSEAYTPIRVPLREVDADSLIEDQIDDQVHRATGHRIGTWANFNSQFSERPLVVILDGYDELLQASGKVFANYLKTVLQFQQREIEHGRPVRVIVTSRVALIDKASIPQGSTVLRLLEFNEQQRAAWIQVWNSKNKDYFNECKPPLRPFEVPKEKKILELAEQPLLLLMLALYDSDGNSLRKETTMDRTLLYDSLLKRFIKRERRKDTSFDDLNEKKQTDEIDREMKRLGVAAIGMYNRKKLHILADELERDLGFFAFGRNMPVEEGQALTQADMLLGSFFFVHKSRVGHGDHVDDRRQTAAFEFLHNTFGEFLTADFILRFAFQETEALHILGQSDSLYAERQRKIQDPDGLVKEWFACLIYAPLFSRPVVLEMLREWAKHQLEKKKRKPNEFLANLDEILRGQISMILLRKNLPPQLRSEDAARFSELPLLGHIAVYTVNLVILRTILDKKEFVFDESHYGGEEEKTEGDLPETRPWDKLTNLWRSWFALENLNGLTAILSARRDGSTVVLRALQTFRTGSSGDRLETVLNVASTLADRITEGLAALLARGNQNDSDQPGLDIVEERLHAEGINLRLDFIVRRLGWCLSGRKGSSEQVAELLREGFHELGTRRQNEETTAAFLRHVIAALRVRGFAMRWGNEIMDRFSHARIIDYFPETRSDLIIEWLRLIREIGSRYWGEGFRHESLDRIIHPRFLEGIIERQPEYVMEWLSLVRELGGRHWIQKRYGPEFMDRVTHPRFFEEIVQQRPEYAIEWLLLVREIGGRQYITERYGQESLNKLVDPVFLEEMIHRRPEYVIEYLRLLKELGVFRLFESPFRKSLFERLMNPRFAEDLLERKPQHLIWLLRNLESDRVDVWLKRFGKDAGDHLAHEDIGRLQISQFADLIWFAEVSKNKLLKQKLGAFIRE